MGQAKRRGTYEERKAAAIAACPKVAIMVPEIPETVPAAPRGTQADPWVMHPNEAITMAGIVMAAMMTPGKKRWRIPSRNRKIVG